MRLVSFACGDEVRPGLRVGRRIVDLCSADPPLPASMLGLLARWADLRPRLSQLAASAGRAQAQHAVDEISLLAPLEPPRVIATGTNYRDHLEEMKVKAPPEPSAFLKLPGSVIGPGDVVVDRRRLKHVDYEGEIALVIGTRARDVPVERAHSVIAGLTLANDLSSRDVPTSHIVLAKGSPGFCPLGPEIVTLDEIDADDISFSVTVNGELRQRAHTGAMVHTFVQLVSAFSCALPLEPGDVILTGTPSGVGIAMSPPRFLEDGDVVVVDSPQLGTLRTRIVAAPGH